MPTKTPPAGPLLTTRQLNRTLLTRQMLLNRVDAPAANVIEHLVGMQAQVPNNPYVGLWSRIQDFDPMALSRLLEDRSAVRMTFLRSTLHLVTARDALALTSVIQPVRDRTFAQSSPYGRLSEGVDRVALLAYGRKLIDEKPRSVSELGKLLHERWPEYDSQALSYNIAYLIPTAQVTPRGLWGKSGRAMITSAEAWLGAPIIPDDAPDAMVLRYLAAFGPASVADIQTWSGLQRLAAVIDRLRPQLRSFHDERGRELLDVLDAPISDPDTEAPVRFMPEYDNAFLSHDDRSRIVSEDNRKRTWLANGYASALLIDGSGGGLWKLIREKSTATLTVQLFDPPTPKLRNQIAAEADKLLLFLASDALTRQVQFLEDQ